jgi:hypothetical protein
MYEKIIIGIVILSIICIIGWYYYKRPSNKYRDIINKIQNVDINNKVQKVVKRGFISGEARPPAPILAAIPERQPSINSTNEVYIINLDERKDRMKQIIKDFGSTFTIFRTSAVKMVPPQQGCTNSFLRIVKMAKDKGMPTVLIFEDDNKPEKDFFLNWKRVKAYLDSHMDTWEIFNGGQRHISNIQKVIQLNNVKLIKPTGGHSTNWIYINSNAYDKLLDWEIKGKSLIDLWLASGHFNTWSCFPLLGLQYNGFSDVNNEERNFDNEDKQIREGYKNLLDNYKS